MACSSCGGPRIKQKVRVTSTYVPKPKVNATEMLMSIKVEKDGVSGEAGKDNSGN